MTHYAPPLLTDPLSAFEAQALTLDDPRPHPPEEALIQLGQAMMTELLDVIGDTALEDFQATISEALIGAFHSAAQRIEREADRARDSLTEALVDGDGSEVDDSNLQAATAKAHAGDVAAMAVEMIRDAASQAYTVLTGEVWQPWKGSVRASRITAAQIQAREVIRLQKARRAKVLDPGTAVVAFRAAPLADTQADANRILDALNWARQTWPDMALATTGARGAEKIAIKWARRAGVTLILAKADFDRNGRSAPFKANDELLDLEPVCVLTLDNSLDPERRAPNAFGPARNLAQKATERGVRSVAVRLRG